jgi:hypothetical protein
VYSNQLQGTEPPAALVEQTVKVSCGATVGFAGFFWAWALRNILTKGQPDLGFLSFPLAAATSYWGYMSLK